MIRILQTLFVIPILSMVKRWYGFSSRAGLPSIEDTIGWDDGSGDEIGWDDGSGDIIGWDE